MTILEALRKAAEFKDEEWSDVYLDNAKPKEMSHSQFRAYLASWCCPNSGASVLISGGKCPNLSERSAP
jgi:hypothetical protein